MSSFFGTDGIRGPVGKPPFNYEELFRLSYAIGRWALERFGARPTVLIAQDTRQSCAWMNAVIKSGLLLHPITLYDANVLPSPALLALMKNKPQFDAAIMISASHNLYTDNGIKIIDALNGKITAQDEERISFLASENLPIAYDSYGSTESFDQADSIYQHEIKKMLPDLALAGKKIVLDCAHGATFALAPALFSFFGATVIPLAVNPNGININKQCGAVYPQMLVNAVIDHQADLGFAFDGDGDRVVAVNASGHVKNGDDILAILLRNPIYEKTTTVVGTVMSNQGFEIYLAERGIKLLRTQVGDKYIAEQLAAHQLLIGGEPSGHIILNDYLPTGDGIFTALRICQTLMETGNWQLETFTKFPQIIINIPVHHKKDLASWPLRDMIDDTAHQLHKGRIIVRYSGTEPLLRIMIEDDDCDHARMLGTLLSQRLEKEIS